MSPPAHWRHDCRDRGLRDVRPVSRRHRSGLWRVGDLLRFRYVRVSGTFIMMTVILSLTGPIEHGQEERQAIEVGTGGVSPVGK